LTKLAKYKQSEIFNMTGITKTNETLIAPVYKNGVTLQFVTISFPNADLTAKLGRVAGVQSPVVQALDAISTIASIEIIGTPRYDTTTTLSIACAALGGAFGTSDYDGDKDVETFPVACQQAIVALAPSTGSLQGYSNTLTTVAAEIRGVAL
jgi:hypothetical protein